MKVCTLPISLVRIIKSCEEKVLVDVVENGWYQHCYVSIKEGFS